jgi:hypothetical protein
VILQESFYTVLAVKASGNHKGELDEKKWREIIHNPSRKFFLQIEDRN